jgi:hypothetical protein
LRARFAVRHATLQIETSIHAGCALALDKVV